MTNQKPIRKDRVALVVVALLAAILIPVLLSSSPGADEDPGNGLVVSDGGGIAGVSATTDPTPEVNPYEILSHTITEGDTLESIARALGVGVANLVASNDLDSGQSLTPGDTIRVPRTGFLYRISSGETLSDIAASYEVTVAEIASANNIPDPGQILAGTLIIVPGDPQVAPSTTVANATPSGSPSFSWPVTGEVVSEFGYRTHPILGTWERHNGIDIDVPEGTIVTAAASGTVFNIDNDPDGIGLAVYLAHTDNFYTVYGHLSQIQVQPGDPISAGQQIALSGNTGLSNGPHLHFEIRKTPEFPIDPLLYLP
ncbi:M23 family metallopeptidase [Candidatus Bipolaricaulota bacterium]|nr:M23 family metallopeptidase [Candidatus Bipolaricaulota bacterium]